MKDFLHNWLHKGFTISNVICIVIAIITLVIVNKMDDPRYPKHIRLMTYITALIIDIILVIYMIITNT